MMSFEVLSTLMIDRTDPDLWQAVEEEISLTLRRDEDALDLDYGIDLREQLRREAFRIQVDGEEVQIAVDNDHYVNLIADI
jgi:hypothetical protein